MSADDFFLVGSRPGSAASNYSDYPSVQTPSPQTTGHKQKHLKYADKLFGKLTVAKDISSRTPHKSKHVSPTKGPMKAISKHNPSFVDETLFGNDVNQTHSATPWEQRNTASPVIFDYTDRSARSTRESPRPASARKKLHTYKSKRQTSYVDETLFGTTNKHLTTNWGSLEIDNAKPKLDNGDMSTRSHALSHRPQSGRTSTRESRPPSRTNIGEGPIHNSSAERPNSRTDKSKNRFNPSYVDETLFGPKLADPDFPAPWEKPEDRNKPRPFFCDSTNYTRTFQHGPNDKAQPKSKTRPSSAKSPAARPAWK